MMFKELQGGSGYGAVQQWSVPRFFNLYLDPTEEHVLCYQYKDSWVRWPIGKILTAHLASLKRYPPIPPGASDPYRPSAQSAPLPRDEYPSGAPD
jgi:hypothetical protein